MNQRSTIKLLNKLVRAPEKRTRRPERQKQNEVARSRAWKIQTTLGRHERRVAVVRATEVVEEGEARYHHYS